MFKRREDLLTNEAGRMPNGFTIGVFLFLLIGLGAGFAGKAEAGLASHAVINEVSIQGATGSGGVNDDWVELFNPTSQAISLTGWSIQKTSNLGGSLEKTTLSGSLPANGYFLIVRGNASTTLSLRNAADVLALDDPFSLAADNIVYLVKNDIKIATSTDSNIIDLVGMGNASYFEGTSTAPNPGAGKSIARIPAGQDTNQNHNDFSIQNNPTPTNSHVSGGNDIGGTVLLTITPDISPVQTINSTNAQIVFQVNSAGTAFVKYGLNSTYASTTSPEAVVENITKTINLTGLACATTYHYAIYAANTGATENDTTSDAVFTTLPCGITLDSLTMTKSSAKANNQYANGWQWEFNITVWNLAETTLKMKFNQWTGGNALDAGANMQYSVDDEGAVWRDITANAAYPADGVDIGSIDKGAANGRQVKIIVRMKVPVGTTAGYYNSSYGILTE